MVNQAKCNMWCVKCKHHMTGSVVYNHPGGAEIIASIGGPGSDIINEGLKLNTIGGQ